MKVINRYTMNLFVCLCLILNIQCKDKQDKSTDETVVTDVVEKLPITKNVFGYMPDSTVVEKYTLKNANGIEMDVITYGGRITSLKVPNKNGDFENVVLGFDNLPDYLNDNPFFGALIGRYGNRIAKGKFTLEGEEYTLATNNGANHLHGGVKGFDKVVWNASKAQTDSTAVLVLTYLSNDMEEGYPGNLKATVTYTLNNNNELEFAYEATTDKTTVVNLTQHAYYNLTADFSKDILGHELVINADAFLPVDETLIPMGEIRNVEETFFDFREAKTIGQDINAEDTQLQYGLGYDHCWVLNGDKGTMRFAASAYDKTSGRLMEIFTEEPAIQFYAGNFLDGTLPMPNGGTYAHRTGFCLETQHYPDSPNQSSFPSVVLKPGETYTTKTITKFSTK